MLTKTMLLRNMLTVLVPDLYSTANIGRVAVGPKGIDEFLGFFSQDKAAFNQVGDFPQEFGL
jgi:hypothetical protein